MPVNRSRPRVSLPASSAEISRPWLTTCDEEATRIGRCIFSTSYCRLRRRGDFRRMSSRECPGVSTPAHLSPAEARTHRARRLLCPLQAWLYRALLSEIIAWQVRIAPVLPTPVCNFVRNCQHIALAAELEYLRQRRLLL